ncbi:hypothetical protein CIL05_17085 [Virgibacillus profundi]|uniref:SAF domain-containing protein n=1 Tax=Virgibacillus profundi TaxID=2024555 RepID=A0A2A2I9E5_9BACI|nr:UxaA family hydrolase [Virgibacillus profundi]PAV28349.1 hypothetical protein CIL05_17085 [Virgibacillus profundi]PXY52289.1 hypothetical protein CIT14_18690 [Virgibacillus profundi]
MKKTAIQITQIDQVATSAVDLAPGDTVLITGNQQLISIKVKEKIPSGHKIAIKDIAEGGEIYKYGEVIGEATEAIHAGHWVHVHNCWGKKGRRLKEEV